MNSNNEKKLVLLFGAVLAIAMTVSGAPVEDIPRRGMQVYVRLITGAIITVDTEPLETVASFKDKIKVKDGRLVFDGVVLEDKYRLLTLLEMKFIHSTYCLNKLPFNALTSSIR